jgi:TonB family protein
VSLPTTRHIFAVTSLALLGLTAGTVAIIPLPGYAQEAPSPGAQDVPNQGKDQLTRKAKTKVAPVYPDIARRMNIVGTVKVMVVVAPNGNLKSSKAVGGHPLLVNAALDAIKKWKFESASEESSGIVEFKFQPQD